MFKAAPDYETPGNSNGDNVYEVELTATAPDGGSTIALVKVTVTDVEMENQVPTITQDGNTALATTDEDTASEAKLVSDLLTAAGYSDSDNTGAMSIAVMAVTGNGVWQFSSNGTTWTDFGAIDTTHALLLDQSYSVRFVPDGTIGGSATLAFRGWDKALDTASADGAAGRTATIIATGLQHGLFHRNRPGHPGGDRRQRRAGSVGRSDTGDDGRGSRIARGRHHLRAVLRPVQ